MNSPKIIDYFVVMTKGKYWPKEIEDHVKASMVLGWVPFGGIATSVGQGFCQAMVKYEQKDQNPLVQIK